LTILERHAGELAAVVHEGLGHVEVEDRDAFVLGVFLLPGRGLHLVEAAAHDHLDVVAAQAARRAAAVHGGVAAAQHDDAPADAGDVAERHRGQPVDADVDVACGFLRPGQVEVAAARRAATDEDRVVALAHQQRLHRIDALAAPEVDAQVQDVAGFFVDHGLGQAKARDLACG
jgi:hypothetical protein